MTDFRFYILDGIGYTVKRHEITPHSPGSETFLGEIHYPVLPLRGSRLTGQEIRIFNINTRTYSDPLLVEAVFKTSRIKEYITTQKIMEKAGGLWQLSLIRDVTKPDENRILSQLIGLMFTFHSYTINHQRLNKSSGFATNALLDTWLEELGSASLITWDQSTGIITISDALTYLTMNAINRSQDRKIFVF